MASRKITTFVVRPVRVLTRFPIDMLRYDTCWPMGLDDVEKIHDSFDLAQPGAIRLVKPYGPPRSERWSSFGWDVVEIDGRQI